MAWRRTKKRWLLLVAATAVASVLLYMAACHVMRRQIASRLEGLFGGAAEIETVSLGLRWHEVRNVRLSGVRSGQVWLSVDSIRHELPLSEVLGGRLTPHQIVLAGVDASVQIDEQGMLVEPQVQLTQDADSDIPIVSISNARVVVRQPNRPDLEFAAIDGEMTPTDSGLALVGTVGESPLGSLSGRVDYNSMTEALQGSAAIDFISIDTNALPELLRRHPSVAALELQKLGHARGRAAVELWFAKPKDGGVEYRVKLPFEAVDLVVADGGLRLDQIAGQLTVENGVVTLSDLQGRIGTGSIRAHGSVEFATPENAGQLDVQLTGVRFPMNIGSTPLPPDVVGTASGRLGLKIRRDGESWILSGTGNAQLDDAAWRDLPFEAVTATLDMERWQLGLPNADDNRCELNFGFAFGATPLAQLVAKFPVADVHLTEFVSGAVSARGKLQVPLHAVRDFASYSASFTASADELTIGESSCGPVTTRIELQQGRVRLEELVLPLRPTGRATLAGDFALVGAGDSQVELGLKQVPIAIVQPYLKQPVALAGSLDGTLALTVPDSSWREPARWRLAGTVRSDALSWGDTTLTELSARVSTDQERLRLQDVRGQWIGTALEGNLTCGVTDPFAFDAQLRVPRVMLEDVIDAAGSQTPFLIKGLASSDARLTGTLQPLHWQGSGAVRADQVTLGDVVVSEAEFPWKIDGHQLAIVDASARLLGGNVQMTGMVPLQGTDSSRIDGRINSLNVQQLSSQLLDKSISLRGSSSGDFVIEHILSPDKRTAELKFAGVKAVISECEFSELAGRINLQHGGVNVQVDGNVLDGSCSFQAESKIDESDGSLHQIRGNTTLREVQLRKLWSAIGQQQRYGPLDAVGDAELDVQLEQLGAPLLAQGTLKLSQVVWERVPLTRELSAKINLSEDQLRVEDARVQIGRGLVIGGATVNRSVGRGEFFLRVNEVPLRALLVTVPDLARKARGNVQGEIKGVLGEQWDATGVLRMDHGSVAGVPLTAIRMPLRVSRVPNSGRTLVDLELQSARIASGRAKGRCQLLWSGGFSIDAKGQLTSADLRPLAKALPGVSDLLNGRVSAKVDVKSGRLRSVNDLTGKFDVRLQQSQTLLLPGLQELSTAVGASSPGAVTFVETTVRGDIQRGVIKLKQATMESPLARIWIDGQLDLRGTMDFNVAIDAGSLSTINLVAATVNPLQLLRRRLVFVHLTGSLQDPVIQPRADQFLAQELVLFFLPVVSLR